ncbi:MAG: LTA synthase family protein [Betaproteobacteria bacterium]|nr:LTA synthase family protein [Betaproteobacteria bacterium]
MKTLFRRLFPGRFALAGIALVAFVAVSFATRLALLVFNGDWSLAWPGLALPAFAIGLAYDLAAAAWWILPFALLAWLWPDGSRSRLPLAVAAVALAAGAFLAWIFTAASELVFWNEFATRFNFIAVDYLVYTHEVIGNIRQSYDLRPAFAAIAVLTALLLAATARPLLAACRPAGMGFGARTLAFAAFALAPAVSFLAVDERLKEFTPQAQAVQLAGNGHWEFFHAFRTNEIDYEQFYRTETLARAYQIMRREFEHSGHPDFTRNGSMPIERQIHGAGPERHLNVVLVSVESLGAEFVGALGDRRHLTPNLDRLAGEGLFFTRVYATGTRTVRGLEALSLSLPPTPGYSVVKRPNNEHLLTIGEIFNEKGYESLYVYGGYGYFDNMNYFFGNNGYTVVDRTAIPSEEIHHENIWGVADEDLFTLALAEADKRHAAGRPFFEHVMTTSNHRPFTYPEGRVDLPSGSGREGAVRYTDWAIGDFIARARTKPWFDDTVFVIVADHTSSARGKTDLPVEGFHIPLLVYSPRNVAPRRVDYVASQIDVAPTVLSLLNFSYRSRFFGQDILTEGATHQRALLGNYQTVGYMEDGLLVELRPKGAWLVLDAKTGEPAPVTERARALVDEAVGYYQSSSQAFRSGALRVGMRTGG